MALAAPSQPVDQSHEIWNVMRLEGGDANAFVRDFLQSKQSGQLILHISHGRVCSAEVHQRVNPSPQLNPQPSPQPPAPSSIPSSAPSPAPNN